MRRSSAGCRLARRAAWLLLAVAVALALGGAQRSPPPAEATHLCALTGSSAGPFQLTVYEAKDYGKVYADVMALAGNNRLQLGDAFFDLTAVKRGARNSRVISPPYVPPVLLKAIAWIESGWAQGAPTVLYGRIGPALVSHDCGYGIMQLTSDMTNVSGTPSTSQLLAGVHYVYNIARGTGVLLNKWNQAPETRPIVGQGSPQLLEDWYFAVWSYNGFAFTNHPSNPYYADTGQGGLGWPRPSYSCGPLDDGYGHDRSRYPYQEMVYGCAAHPPQPGGKALWPGQEINLPDLSDPVVAKALDPKNFRCEVDSENPDNPQRRYCFDDMDMPTPSYPGKPPHSDPTRLEASRDAVVGSPRLAVKGPTAFNLAAGGGSDTAAVTIQNAGTGILVWTAVASTPWLKVSPWQGVALGSDLGLQPATLTIQVDRAAMPRQASSGSVQIVASKTSGSPITVTVSVSSSLASLPVGTLTPAPLATEDVPLVAGRCNPVTNTYASATAISPTLMDAIVLPQADDAVWKYFPAENRHRGARRDAPAFANDLTAVEFLDVVGVCRFGEPGVFRRPKVGGP